MVRIFVRPTNWRDENVDAATTVEKSITRLCSPSSLHVKLDVQLHFNGQVNGTAEVIVGLGAMVGTAANITISIIRRETLADDENIFCKCLRVCVLPAESLAIYKRSVFSSPYFCYRVSVTKHYDVIR